MKTNAFNKPLSILTDQSFVASGSAVNVLLILKILKKLDTVGIIDMGGGWPGSVLAPLLYRGSSLDSVQSFCP